MESAEQIVEAYARQVRGLATIANIRCEDRQEIKLLAIDPADPTRRLHIEICVSLPSDMAGINLAASQQALARRPASLPRTRRALDDFIGNKFNSETIGQKLQEYGFVDGQYQKVLVIYGPTPAAKAAAANANIDLWSFKSLLQALTKRRQDDPPAFAVAPGALDGSGIRPRLKARLSALQLWNSKDSKAWDRHQGELYDSGVRPAKREIERQLEKPGLRARIARMSAREFYEFLRDEYYPMIFTAKSQLIGAVKALAKHASEDSIDRVEKARQRLVNRVYDRKADALGMLIGKQGGVHGLTVAGASGLLALVYPDEFASVDGTVMKALQQIGAIEVERANPKDVSMAEAETMIEIMRIKALELNRAFGAHDWTPRRVARALTVAAR